KGYLYDHLNAKLTGHRSTGSGRRQSFRYAPLPRMTNTYLAPGDQTPEEIVGGVAKGLYCRQFGGGQVDISNGNFVFEISEAYVERTRDASVRVRDGEVEALHQASSKGIGLRVISGQKLGFTYGTDLSKDGLRKLAENAVALARGAAKDKANGLPRGAQLGS